MNLEVKAEEYVKSVGYEKPEDAKYCIIDFTAGYNECKTDLIDFIKANPKSTAEQILKHLEELK